MAARPIVEFSEPQLPHARGDELATQRQIVRGSASELFLDPVELEVENPAFTHEVLALGPV